MDGNITDNKRQSVGHFKTLLAERSGLSFPGDTQGRFVNQLQSHPGINFRGLFAGPSTKEIPGPETQVLRNKHPDASEVAGDLITKELANLSFNTSRITGLHSAGFHGPPGFDPGGIFRGEWDMEFFFEGHIQK